MSKYLTPDKVSSLLFVDNNEDSSTSNRYLDDDDCRNYAPSDDDKEEDIILSDPEYDSKDNNNNNSKEQAKLPAEFVSTEDIKESTTLHCYQKETMIVSYCPKKRKVVTLLSTMYSDKGTESPAPEVITYYSTTQQKTV